MSRRRHVCRTADATRTRGSGHGAGGRPAGHRAGQLAGLPGPRRGISLEPPGRIRLGRWGRRRGRGEVVVAAIDPARVEIHCHGGVAAPRAICDALRRGRLRSDRLARQWNEHRAWRSAAPLGAGALAHCRKHAPSGRRSSCSTNIKSRSRAYARRNSPADRRGRLAGAREQRFAAC